MQTGDAKRKLVAILTAGDTPWPHGVRGSTIRPLYENSKVLPAHAQRKGMGLLVNAIEQALETGS